MKLNEICQIQKLPQHSGSKEKPGNLAVLEFSALTWTPNRILYVCGTPAGSVRGQHAHHKNKQIVLCIQGQIDVSLWNGYNTVMYNLFPCEYIYVPQMVWDEQTYVTGNDIMMSIHSLPFDPEDHITDRELFLQLTKRLARIPKKNISKRSCRCHTSCST